MPSLPITLPDGFTPLVSVDEMVSVKQPLAVRKDTSNAATIAIADELSLSPAKAAKAMQVNPGEAVSPGTVIASRSGLFGMGGQKVVSSISGKVLGFDRKTGDVTIQIDGEVAGEDQQYLSPVAGKISMCDNGKIVIDTETDGAETEAGSGGSVKGEVYVVKHDSESPVPLHLLTPEIIGKIIVGREFDRDGLLKAVGMEALGIVVLHISEEDLAYVAEKRMTVPIVKVSEEEFHKIKKRSGKEIYLDGEQKSVVILHT